MVDPIGVHEPASPEEIRDLLAQRAYVADLGLATALFVASRLRRPLLLEGEPGIGKTELAKTFADVRGARLIRLQCYEGIDASQALYDWNFARQMIHIRAVEQRDVDSEETVSHVFGREFLIRRPLLEALESEEEVVLLIDEIDRADDEFEALLLELLSDFQVTIPEIGTVVAVRRPLVLLTSNRTRELHDALKRRCLYHWIDYPDPERELAILRARMPGIATALAEHVCAVVAQLRTLDLQKPPGIAETLDWTSALTVLGAETLDEATIRDSLGALLKVREDQQRVLQRLAELALP